MTSVRSLADLLADPSAAGPGPPVTFSSAWKGRLLALVSHDQLEVRRLAARAAAARSRGRPFLGRRLEAGSCLLLHTREPASVVAQRLEELGADPGRVYLLDLMDRLDDEPLALLREAIEASGAELVLLDSLGAFWVLHGPGSGNERAAMEQLQRVARETGAGLVLFIHRGARNLVRLLEDAGIDPEMVTERSEAGADGELAPPGRSNGSENKSEITGSDTEEGSGRETAALEELDEAVLRCVTTDPGRSTNQVKKAVTGRGTAIAESLERLERASKIENRGSSARSAWYPTEGGP